MTYQSHKIFSPAWIGLLFDLRLVDTTSLTLRDKFSLESWPSFVDTAEEHQLGSQMHESSIPAPSLPRGVTLGKLLNLSI